MPLIDPVTHRLFAAPKPDKGWQLQTVLFPLKTWTKKKVSAWLLRNKLLDHSIEMLGAFYHCRQMLPGLRGKTLYKTVRRDEGVQMVYELMVK